MKLKIKHLVFLGWLCFAISLLLPVTSFMDARFNGWEALLISFGATAEFYKNRDSAHLALGGIINFIFLLSPLLYWINSRGMIRFTWKAMFLSTLIAFSYYPFFNPVYKKEIGYYFWSFSFMITAIGLYSAASMQQIEHYWRTRP